MARRALRGMRGIVTGASSGIGRALALNFARKGVRLVLSARREDRLNELATEIRRNGGEAHVVGGEVGEDEVRQRIVATAERELGGLDLLVNNAGMGAWGPFADADANGLRRVMEVNFFAPVELIRRSLPLLRGGVRPAIVNIGSVLGHRAVPNKSEYCASKFALHGFSDALRAELAAEGIHVLLVSPSTTRTDFFDSALGRQRDPQVGRPRGASAESVAKYAVRALERGRHEIVLSAGGRLLVWLDRLCPPLADRLVARFGK